MIPRDHTPAESEEQRHDDRHIALAAVRRVQLAALFTKAATHRGTNTRGPRGAAFLAHADIKANGRPHVPELQRDDHSEDTHGARPEKAVTQVQVFLANQLASARQVPPGIDVLGADKHRQHQRDERERQERGKALEDAYHGARPARGGDALHRDKHHAGRRNRREEQPIRVERLPGAAVAAHGAVREDGEAGDEHCKERLLDRRRNRLVQDRLHAIARGARSLVGAHCGWPSVLVSAAPSAAFGVAVTVGCA